MSLKYEAKVKVLTSVSGSTVLYTSRPYDSFQKALEDMNSEVLRVSKSTKNKGAIVYAMTSAVQVQVVEVVE